MVPDTRYVRTGDVSIAYQVIGKGPIALVLVPGWISNIEIFWEDPNIARFLQRLADFSRLIVFDKRGTGLSDRITEAATLEERMDDVRAVMDALGLSRAALLGYSEGGSMCALFAATYPRRTAALITIGSYARRLKAPDYPYFVDKEEALKGIAAYAEEWGGPALIEQRLPSVANDPMVRMWWSRFVRMSASASADAALQRLNIDIDIRHILPSIRVPTLILHATDDRVVPLQAGRYMADRIPHAQFVEVNSIDHLPFFDKPDEFIRHIEEFLTGASGSHMAETSVRTLMFTDIVGSTQLAVEKRDQRFSDLLEAHHAMVRRELSLHRGQEINTTGDGFLASFDGPARAIRCAVEVTRSLAGIGLTSRIGLHTGECEIREGRLHGVALHIASRVCDVAPPGGVLVSQTVRDLVAGSGLQFADRGSHSLKGLPDRWRLFEVDSSTATIA
jgi:pimeloyl-ACP methyl ester carboxylesterase